jgi:hypothetical protein
MLTLRFYGRIADVDPARWDALAPEALSAHAVLAALEGAGMAGVTFRYAVVLDGAGRWLAGAPMATLPVDGARLTHGLFHALIGAVRAAAPSFLRTRIALCGAPLSVGTPPVRMSAAAPPGPVCEALAPALKDYARECRAPWLAFKEFAEPALPWAEGALAPRGYLLAPSESGCVLPLAARRYADYLGALRSHYRYVIRRAERGFADAGGTVRTASLASDYGPSHHALYDAVRGRAAVGLEWLTAEFFTGLGRALGDRAALLEFHARGRLIGWVAAVRDGDTLIDLFHGIDYAALPETRLYTNQLAAVVRFAIERGARAVSLGQSTLEAKARFGAEPAPLWVAVRHRSPAVRALLRTGRRALFPEPAAPRHRVFADGRAPVGSPMPEGGAA